jgi:putative membrane protein
MPCEDAKDKIMHQVMRLVAQGLARGRLKMEVAGLHHVPARGPAILVARHYHHLFDGAALHWAIARRIHIFVTIDWATDPCTRFFMEALIRAARWPAVLRADALERGAQSTDLQSRSVFTAADLSRYQRRAIHDSIGLLREGRLLVIFPEGYPNIDPHYTPKVHADEMLPFKSGFAAIAAAAEKRLGASIPLVPVGIRYTVGAKWTAHVSFGDPRSAGDFVSRQTLVKKLEQDVAALSNLSPREENSGRNNNP